MFYTRRIFITEFVECLSENLPWLTAFPDRNLPGSDGNEAEADPQ